MASQGPTGPQGLPSSWHLSPPRRTSEMSAPRSEVLTSRQKFRMPLDGHLAHLSQTPSMTLEHICLALFGHPDLCQTSLDPYIYINIYIYVNIYIMTFCVDDYPATGWLSIITSHRWFCKMLHLTPVSLTMGLDFGPFSTGTWRDQLQSPWLPVAKRSRKAGLKSATLLMLEAPPPRRDEH